MLLYNNKFNNDIILFFTINISFIISHRTIWGMSYRNKIIFHMESTLQNHDFCWHVTNFILVRCCEVKIHQYIYLAYQVYFVLCYSDIILILVHILVYYL